MDNFFSLDGKFYKIGTVAGEIVMIGLLWTIFSIPIVTMGASTTALYYIQTRRVSGKDSYIFEDFWNAFKENFVKSTCIFLILAVIGVIAWINLHVLRQIDMGWLNIPVAIVLYFVLVQLAFVATNVFAIVSRFEMSIAGALKMAVLLANRHFIITIMHIALLVIIWIGVILFPILLLFMMGLYVYLSSILLIKIFRRHSPDFNKSIINFENSIIEREDGLI